MAILTRYITAADTVNRVLRILGLPVTSSPAGATDSTSTQIWQLLSECGQEIVDESLWKITSKTFTQVVQAPVLNYAVPVDLQSFVDSTGWNLTSRIPLLGPMTDQQWALLQARQLGGTTLRMQYIIEGGFLKLYFAPSDPQTISIAYQSRGWVRDATVPSIFKDNAEFDGDVILFDSRMMVTKLLLEWRKRKGFDTIDEQMAYDKALQNAKYDDAPKQDLGTSGRNSFPYLGLLNISDTNYGA